MRCKSVQVWKGRGQPLPSIPSPPPTLPVPLLWGWKEEYKNKIKGYQRHAVIPPDWCRWVTWPEEKERGREWEKESERDRIKRTNCEPLAVKKVPSLEKQASLCLYHCLRLLVGGSACQELPLTLHRSCSACRTCVWPWKDERCTWPFPCPPAEKTNKKKEKVQKNLLMKSVVCLWQKDEKKDKRG